MLGILTMEIYKKESIMVIYSHIVSAKNNGELVLTIAFDPTQKKLNDEIPYGVAVVSSSEPSHKVCKKTGRKKSESRMTAATFHNSAVLWGKYGSRKVGDFYNRHLYTYLESVELNKLGWMLPDDLKAAIKSLRQVFESPD
jgi:hypothetical protein